MSQISRYAFLITSVDCGELKTFLEVKEIKNGKTMRIGFNNSNPLPFLVDSFKPVEIVFKVKKENSDAFTSSPMLMPYLVDNDPSHSKIEDSLLSVCSTSVFPLEIGDILVIECPSIYDDIAKTLKKE